MKLSIRKKKKAVNLLSHILKLTYLRIKRNQDGDRKTEQTISHQRVTDTRRALHPTGADDRSPSPRQATSWGVRQVSGSLEGLQSECIFTRMDLN